VDSPRGHWLSGKFDLHGRALVWPNSPGQATMIDIPPGGERYVDLTSIVRDWQNQGMIDMTLQIGPPDARAPIRSSTATPRRFRTGRPSVP
jgi:hypothetical protein